MYIFIINSRFFIETMIIILLYSSTLDKTVFILHLNYARQYLSVFKIIYNKNLYIDIHHRSLMYNTYVNVVMG